MWLLVSTLWPEQILISLRYAFSTLPGENKYLLTEMRWETFCYVCFSYILFYETIISKSNIQNIKLFIRYKNMINFFVYPHKYLVWLNVFPDRKWLSWQLLKEQTDRLCDSGLSLFIPSKVFKGEYGISSWLDKC